MIRNRPSVEKGLLFTALFLAAMAGLSGRSHAAFFVDSYGAKPDGSADSTSAVNAAIAAAIQSGGPAEVVFSPGTYRLDCAGGTTPDICFTIRNAHNLTIRGQGAGTQLLISNPRAGLLAIHNSSQIAVTGFTVDYTSLPFTQGIIRAISSGEGSIDLEVEAGYPRLDSPLFNPADLANSFGIHFEPNTPWPKGSATNYHHVSLIQPLGGNRFRLHLVEWSNFETGDRFALAIRNQHGFWVDTTTDFLLKDVTLYTGPGAGSIWIGNRGKIVIDGFQVRRKPGTTRLLSTQADAIHMADNAVNLIIKNCYIEGMGDDAINTRTTAFQVSAVWDGTHLKFTLPQVPSGSTLQVVNPETQRPRGAARITSVNSDASGSTVSLDHPINGMKVNDLVFIADLASPNALIRNNTFSNFRGMFRIRSSGAIFAGNTIIDPRNAVVLEGADVSPPLWIEGPSLVNSLTGVTYYGNTVQNGSISVLDARYVFVKYASQAIENLLLHPLVYDPLDYRVLNPDLANATDSQLAMHWVNHGISEGRQAAVSFSAPEYLQLYPDLKAAFGSDFRGAIAHYLLHGAIDESRQGSVFLNSRIYKTSDYRALNPDLAGMDDKALAFHWLSHGIYEGRQAISTFNSRDSIRGDADVPAGFGAATFASALFYYAVYGPLVGQAPQSQTVNAYQRATFHVVMTQPAGSDLRYQWQSKASGTAGFSDISGANAASYARNAVSPSDNGLHLRCVVSIQMKNTTYFIFSNFATLTVVPAPVATDYDGDRKSDIAVWKTSNGMLRVRTAQSNFTSGLDVQWGTQTDVVLQGDYDGDRKTDGVVWRPSNGIWYIKTSASNFTTHKEYQWGIPADIPMGGSDYDGDGIADLTVWRPSDGTWYIKTSSTQFAQSLNFQWGAPGDIPIGGGDYDGDGVADLVVWRPSSGFWYIKTSSTHFAEFLNFQWGLPGDIPIGGADYDGDGKNDLAIWRPSDGTWWIRSSGSNFTDTRTYQWGVRGDIPVSADFDGDGKADLVVWRPSEGNWWILTSASNFTQHQIHQFGSSTDIPIAGMTVPVAHGQSIATPVNTALPITLSAWDPKNLPLVYTIVTLPTHGTLSGVASNITYTPNARYAGTDSFTFKVNNGYRDSLETTVPITILLNLPEVDLSGINGKTFTLNDTISLIYSGNATGFNWEFNPLTHSPASAPTRISTPVDTVATAVPRFNLASIPLQSGPYTVRVQAVHDTVTSAWANATITLAGEDLVGVIVSPNPWRADRHGNHPITFDHLTVDATIKIFTVSGHWVRSLTSAGASSTWDRKDDSGNTVSSGLYLYAITTPSGQKKTGQIAIVK